MAPSPRYESSPSDVSQLGQPLPFAFSGKTASNRFLKASMTERLSSWSVNDLPARGIPSENLINVYRRWGEGEFGVILTGNVMIESDQLEAAGNPIVPRGAPFSGERFEAFKRMGAAAKQHGALCVAQVSHPGRQTPAELQSNPVSASAIKLEGNPMGMSFAPPHAASEQEIEDIIDGFAHTAEYLYRAGYDGVELHGAHGYLLAQFLSETTNKRTDKYGGSLENRFRLISRISEEIRSRTSSSFILGIKLNSVEFQDGGISPEQANKICELLENHQFDFVELSGGTYQSLRFHHERESTRKREGFFLEFAEQVVPALKHTKAYVTGGFRTAGAMVDALHTVDGIGLARPICQEPRLPHSILSGKVTGAIKQAFDQDNFMITNVVAGSQIRQIGRDQEPFDGSSEDQRKAFEQDMKTWQDEMKEQGLQKFGYVDMHAVQIMPYNPESVY